MSYKKILIALLILSGVIFGWFWTQSLTQEQTTQKTTQNLIKDATTQNTQEFSGYDVPLDLEVQKYTNKMCLTYGVPIELAFAVMRLESNFTFDIVSRTNDYGIMQINGVNHEWLMDKFGFDDIMAYENNIRSGVYMLGLHLEQADGDITLALMMYNNGVNGARAKVSNGQYGTDYTRIVERYYQEML